MKQTKTISGKIAAYPHIFWSVLFIVLPLLFVIYFAFTTPDGAFTLDNISALREHASTFVLSVSLSVIATFFCFWPIRWHTSWRMPSRSIKSCI